MPDGTTTSPQTMAGTSFLDALMARIADVDLASVTYPETDPAALDEIRREAATGTVLGPMPDNLKRLWFLKTDIDKALRAKAEQSVEHLGPLIADAALRNVKGDDPRLDEVRERHRDMSNSLFERELIEMLYDRELVSVCSDLSHGSVILVDPDFVLHVLPPRLSRMNLEDLLKEFGLEEFVGKDMPDFGGDSGFVAQLFGRRR